jgi:hypothetical protein
LIDIASACRAGRFPAWATLAMARPSQLEGRLVAILDDRCNRRPPARWIRAAVGASAVALLLPIGALRLTAASTLPEPVPSASATQPATAAVAAAEENTVSLAVETDQADSDPQPAAVAVDDAGEPPQIGAPAIADFVEDVRAQVLDALGDFELDFDWYGPLPMPLNIDPYPDFDYGDPGQEQAQSGSPPSDETRRRVADALIAALNDENEEVREQALTSLAGMRDPRAIPGLLKRSATPARTSARRRSSRSARCGNARTCPRCCRCSRTPAQTSARRPRWRSASSAIPAPSMR